MAARPGRTQDLWLVAHVGPERVAFRAFELERQDDGDRPAILEPARWPDLGDPDRRRSCSCRRHGGLSPGVRWNARADRTSRQDRTEPGPSRTHGGRRRVQDHQGHGIHGVRREVESRPLKGPAGARHVHGRRQDDERRKEDLGDLRSGRGISFVPPTDAPARSASRSPRSARPRTDTATHSTGGSGTARSRRADAPVRLGRRTQQPPGRSTLGRCEASTVRRPSERRPSSLPWLRLV